MRMIRGIEPKNVWERGLRLIMDKGVITNNVKEVINLVTRIENPFGEYPKMRERLLSEYKNVLLEPKNKGFSYTYGERLRGGEIDQISAIIERIKKNNHTRRATATTWIPKIDLVNEEVPCMVLIDFKLRDKLELTAVFRSHDFYGAYPYNLYALSKLLEYVSNEIQVESGGITIHSISAHIYLTDINNIKSIL